MRESINQSERSLSGSRGLDIDRVAREIKRLNQMPDGDGTAVTYRVAGTERFGGVDSVDNALPGLTVESRGLEERMLPRFLRLIIGSSSGDTPVAADVAEHDRVA